MSRDKSQISLRQSRPKFVTLISSFFLRHLQVFFYTLGQLTKTPFSTLLTSASLGIALALPAGLNEMLLTVQNAGSDFTQVNKISLFLKKGITEKEVAKLEKQLKGMPEIIEVEHISEQQALDEFKQHSGFGDALKALEDNPLPHLFIVEPSMSYSDPLQVEQLSQQLKNLPGVDLAQLDIRWLKRLFSIIEIGKTGIMVVTALLAMAVLLIIGNTIRLAIENRRSEILIMKLIGGTNSFICRPFLYLGFWYGFFGGIVAIILVDISLYIISQPMLQLRELYQTELFDISLMSYTHNLQVLVSAILLGLFGAWVAVRRQLRLIEPT